jgi:hypothetical protein
VVRFLGLRFFYIIFCLLILNAQTASATGYPSALPNHDLGEEIKDQPDRILPKSDLFTATVDGQAYMRNLGIRDFYHGQGYWIQGRAEVRPHDSFRLNLRSIFYSGSHSGGYVEPTGSYELFGLTGIWPGPVMGGKLEGRAIDLERQTIGQGLMIEEKELNGVMLKWSREGYSIRYLTEGTGGLLLGDDMDNLEVQLFDGYLGGGYIEWPYGNQSQLDHNRASLYYVTSAHAFGSTGFGYFAEAGSRDAKYAGLLGFKGESVIGKLNLKSRVQGRYYEDRFAEEFAGSIQQMYVSYDQYDKRFTNAGNVFAKGDSVNVYSVILDADYDFNQRWQAHVRSEVGRFDFKKIEDQKFAFYRIGTSFFPLENRKESITFFISNKVLTDSFKRPPNEQSMDNMPLFHEIDFYGVEANFRF